VDLPKILCPNCRRRWLASGWFVGEIWCKTCKRVVKIIDIDFAAAQAYIRDSLKKVA